ncbi:MAG: hypothetical protein LBH71_03060, partial [Oscillospiraceae bacterium]|nr:hypothetical protein [Oscillospiraceae bacterium]
MNDNAAGYKKPVKLQKIIKRALLTIRKDYKKALSSKSFNKINEWLCDNYYIFEREGRSAIKSLDKASLIPVSKNGEPRIYGICKSMCKDAILPPQNEIEEYINPLKPTVKELELFPVMLKSVFLNVIARNSGANEERAEQQLANAVNSLRRISDIDFETLTENVSVVERILVQDPAGIYQNMDDRTKAFYRRQIARIAGGQKMEEETLAQDILTKASNDNEHIGRYLNITQNHKKRGWWLIAMQVIVPLIVSAGTGLLLRNLYVPFLVYFPLYEIFQPILSDIFMRGVSPSFIPRMKIEKDIPKEAATLVVISMLMPGAKDIKNLSKKLIHLKRSNGLGAVKFCVLADFKSSKLPKDPQDESDLYNARKMIEDLNDQYDGGFILAVRPRTFSKTQNEYTGWERKRGAITQLIRAIKGENVQFEALAGDMAGFDEIKYIMALDADTGLPMDSVKDLVSAAVHPINRPVIDVSKGRVTSGYAILTPKIETDIKSAFSTGFSRVMAGVGGITAYNNTSSDKYQDLFGEAIFAGKGLLDVDVFHKLLNGNLPAERVLSHDILEGGYMRACYISDVQVTDGFPSSQGSFFDRQHRWIRGDWQNIGFIFKRRPQNPLNGLSRYKLIDNIRRSVTPPVFMAALILSLLLPYQAAFVTVAIVILGVCFGELLTGVISILFGGMSMFLRLYYSGAMPIALKTVANALVSVVMLPQNAWVSLNASVIAIWRMAISKKNLLQWVTAAQSEKTQSFIGFIKRYIPSFILGLALVIFGNSAHILIGLVFIANVPFAWISAKSLRKSLNEEIDYKSKEKLTSYAAAMWRFYDELCGERDNYLPPDNFQETPVHRIAHRTSPTNIGLMLLCTLCAKDFGFIDTEKMCTRLEQSLDSIDKLEKWHGNLLNWYNTKTLMPLTPKYVSTVDSGNFLCSLTALRQGLRELEEKSERIDKIIYRITKIINSSDLSVLYNERRKLFYIGYSVSDESYSNSYYDLLMSEARMTSFYAIARRQVSKEHWGMLGRTLAKEGRYAGPVSWTGTMFEYYMPNLLLPVYENTMSYEALRFFLWCQKRRVTGKNIPWGISESGFYAFDSQLNYQYKAHGVQKLGLKRGLNDEMVISPYSTFLTLPFDPKPAVKNLMELEDLQLTGRCGFYEAADFTQERTEGQDYAVVRSYMAHHVGMSMICITNALMDNIIQKRFINDSKMSGAISILQEKIPSGSTVFKDVDTREIPQRPHRTVAQIREFRHIDPLSPNVRLYTNGEWNMIMSDLGVSISRYQGADMTRISSDLLRNPMGIFAFIKSDKFAFPITKALDYNNKSRFRASFSNTEMTLSSSAHDLECYMSAMVHPRIPCEQRKITVKNTGKNHFKGELVIYVEPSLISHKEEENHPAFTKLFLQGEYDKANNLMIYTRQSRNSDESLCLAVGFVQDTDYLYSMSREAVLESPSGIQSIMHSDLPLVKEGAPDLCALIRIPITVTPKSSKTNTLILCAASTRTEAVDRALKVRSDGTPNSSNASPSPFKDGRIDGVIASMVFPYILFSNKRCPESIEAIKQNTKSKKTIWEFGISGDNPIIYIQVDTVDDVNKVLPYIRLVRKLRKSGIITDLIIAYKERGEYTAPILSAIRQMMQREGKQEVTGVFPIDLSKYDESSIMSLIAIADYVAPKNEKMSSYNERFTPFSVRNTQGRELKEDDALVVKSGYFTHGAFTVTEKPKIPWCVVLSNDTFGTLVSDKSIGFTWAINSRENKLTPWSNDTITDNIGEMLYIRINGIVYNMIAKATVRFSTKIVQYLGTVQGINYDVTVWVPSKGMIKHLDVKLKNTRPEEKKIDILYYTEPVMGIDRKDSKLLTAKFDDKGILISNKCSSGLHGFMRVGMLSSADYLTCDRVNFLCGKWTGSKDDKINDLCAAVGKRIELQQQKQETVRFTLTWGSTEKSAHQLSEKNLGIEQEERTLYIKTPDKAINYMFNTWLTSQIINSRIKGRTGFYQCGGAYGFRDQLQDVSSLMLVNPKLAKTHIIRSAASQFKQGDVLHWWHVLPHRAGRKKGVRTKYTDDLLWLPFVAAEYAEKTGDYDIFNINIAYLDGEPLAHDEDERYFEPPKSAEKGSLYEHCIRALDLSLRFGEHGLSLIGGGDWNDGFNLVGINGSGESVWLSQFLCMVLEKMAKVAQSRGDTERVEVYTKEIGRLKKAIDDHAWDGQWYMRAFYDDGKPMGSSGARECEIDLLPQAFSVLSNMPDDERKQTALNKVLEKLVDEDNQILKLFYPPFDQEGKQAGYVNAYPSGIRENSGQYTHAAVWFCMALIESGNVDTGYKILKMLNPAQKYKDIKQAIKYKTEPYALSGDVYSKEGISGRGGWTLYSGTAGWFYRCIYENLLGLWQVENKLYIKPKLP